MVAYCAQAVILTTAAVVEMAHAASLSIFYREVMATGAVGTEKGHDCLPLFSMRPDGRTMQLPGDQMSHFMGYRTLNEQVTVVDEHTAVIADNRVLTVMEPDHAGGLTTQIEAHLRLRQGDVKMAGCLPEQPLSMRPGPALIVDVVHQGSGQISVTKAVGGVVIDQPHGLHIGVADSGTDKSEPRLFELFRELVRKRGAGRHLLDGFPSIGDR